MQLEPISSHPIVSYLGEETNTCLTTTSFQVLVESVVEYVDHGDVGDKEKVNNSLFLDSLSPITKYWFLHGFKRCFHPLFQTWASFGTFLSCLSVYKDGILLKKSIKLIGGKLMEQAGMLENNYLCIAAFDKFAVWGDSNIKYLGNCKHPV